MTQYLIERKNPESGFTEQIIYTGSLKDKPKGWKVIKQTKFDYWTERDFNPPT